MAGKKFLDLQGLKYYHRKLKEHIKELLKDVDRRLEVIHHTAQENAISIVPNVMHVWGEVERLNLSLAPNMEPTILAEYCFQFSTPTNKATEFQLHGVEWHDGVVPTIIKGRTYQGSVVNGVAILIGN